MREMIAEEAAAEERKSIIRLVRRIRKEYSLDSKEYHADSIFSGMILDKLNARQDRYLKSKHIHRTGVGV